MWARLATKPNLPLSPYPPNPPFTPASSSIHLEPHGWKATVASSSRTSPSLHPPSSIPPSPPTTTSTREAAYWKMPLRFGGFNPLPTSLSRVSLATFYENTWALQRVFCIRIWVDQERRTLRLKSSQRPLLDELNCAKVQLKSASMTISQVFEKSF